MKKLIYCISLMALLYSNNAKSQSKDATGAIVAAGVGLIAAGVAADIAIEQYKEEMELRATEYILANYSQMYNFNLSVMDLNGVKLTDLSNTTCITFSIESYNERVNNFEKFVLLMFVSKGWINEYGVNSSMIKFKLLNKTEWNKLFVTYCNMAIKQPQFKIDNFERVKLFSRITARQYSESDTSNIKIKASEGEIYYRKKDVSLGQITINGNTIEVANEISNFNIPLIKQGGDSYIIRPYNDEFKIVYNENSLGIFFKDWEKLIQVKRNSLNTITKFLNN
jgi:hypothetical protein